MVAPRRACPRLSFWYVDRRRPEPSQGPGAPGPRGRAVRILPERSQRWTNLGIALLFASRASIDLATSAMPDARVVLPTPQHSRRVCFRPLIRWRLGVFDVG